MHRGGGWQLRVLSCDAWGECVGVCRYGVDYRASGFNHWGYQAGCEFAESPVKDVIASEETAVQRFKCQRELAASTECTVDLTSLGVCTTDSSFDGLSHVQVRRLLLLALLPSLSSRPPPLCLSLRYLFLSCHATLEQ